MKQICNLLIVITLICSAPAVAGQGYPFSEDVTLIDGNNDRVSLEVSATAPKKKDAEALAIKSAFNALFYSGVEGLNNAQPLLTERATDYDYRFYTQQRYLQYMTSQPVTLNTVKVGGSVRATVRLTINLKALRTELARNELAMSPAWSDSKKSAPTASYNPTIVVVPATTAAEGDDFESMRRIIDTEPVRGFAVARVAQAFQNHGYKTRNFVAMLQNNHNDEFMRGDAQTDDRTMMVQQLPGDIIVMVGTQQHTGGDGSSSASVSIVAIERQTTAELGRVSFTSDGYYTTDGNRLVGYAVDKIQEEFFRHLDHNFKAIINKGREVIVDFTLAQGVDWDFDSESPATGDDFKVELEEWLRNNSFGQTYDMSTHTDKYIRASVNVPLWNAEKNRSYTLSNFSNDLKRFLRAQLGEEYAVKITSLGQKLQVEIR